MISLAMIHCGLHDSICWSHLPNLQFLALCNVVDLFHDVTITSPSLKRLSLSLIDLSNHQLHVNTVTLQSLHAPCLCLSSLFAPNLLHLSLASYCDIKPPFTSFSLTSLTSLQEVNIEQVWTNNVYVNHELFWRDFFALLSSDVTIFAEEARCEALTKIIGRKVQSKTHTTSHLIQSKVVFEARWLGLHLMSTLFPLDP